MNPTTRSRAPQDRPTALVTGASRGLGAAIARALAPDHRVLLGGRDRDALDALAAELPDARPWVVDLLDDDAVARACITLESEEGGLDVLVHNAGVASLGTIADADLAAWRHMIDVNLLSVVGLTSQLLPALRAAHGHVVLVNSGAGLRARAGWGGYAASKFALRAFGDALRDEEPDLRVTSVHPGRIDTDMQRAVVEQEGGEYEPERYLSPDTVARAVAQAVATPRDAHPVEIVLRVR